MSVIGKAHVLRRGRERENLTHSRSRSLPFVMLPADRARQSTIALAPQVACPASGPNVAQAHFLIGAEGSKMDGDQNTAKRYRQRAQQVRVAAGQMVDKEAADLLLSIAADYEHMAETMETIAKSDIARSKQGEP